jgi:hypothetical protein
MVAHILELAQVVGCDYGCEAAVIHIVCKNTFYCLAHDGIKTVKGFVAQQISGTGADPAQNSELFFHTAGIMLYAAFGVQGKIRQHFPEADGIEFRVDSRVEAPYILCVSVSEKAWIVRDKKDILTDCRIVVHGLAADFNPAGILTQDTADHPQKGAFAGSVCAYQTEYLAVFNLERDIIYGSDIPESFCQIPDCYHFFLYSPLRFCIAILFSCVSRPRRSRSAAETFGSCRLCLAAEVFNQSIRTL